MEGYWVTHFRAGPFDGEGLVMLHEGELVGGDAERVWRGTYEVNGSHVYARVRIVPLVTRDEEELMAREKPQILSLEGTWTGEYAWLDGHPDEREDMPFHLEMQRCHSKRNERVQAA